MKNLSIILSLGLLMFVIAGCEGAPAPLPVTPTPTATPQVGAETSNPEPVSDLELADLKLSPEDTQKYLHERRADAPGPAESD